MSDTTPAETGKALIISSDGHAVAHMADYRPYLPAGYREEFDAFCEVHAREGSRTIDPKSLSQRIDAELVERWVKAVIEPGRTAGQSDPHQRLKELDHEGIAGEVIFPDFGLPFELYPPLIAALRGYAVSPDKVEVANRAHNRWLADFCAAAPERLKGLGVVSFVDVDATVEELRWAKDAGLAGIVLPAVDESVPFFHPRYEPIWSALEELELPVATHTAISSVTKHMATGTLTSVPHPACALPIMTAQAFFFTQQILTHLVWGGVLDRHPTLHVALTEQGSGWVISALRGMDYSWESSYLRRDVREVVRRKPSEYFARQVHMGSSLFSLAEAQARHEIGVDKICIGMDYPHHEGTWGSGPGTLYYLQCTLGAAGVPAAEARRMLGANAAALWGFDAGALTPTVDRIGFPLKEILKPPAANYYPRGDVHKPLATAF
ncbi:MAG TPA: amidohydrolase family protein [Acidimicrobiia bacterium]